MDARPSRCVAPCGRGGRTATAREQPVRVIAPAGAESHGRAEPGTHDRPGGESTLPQHHPTSGGGLWLSWSTTVADDGGLWFDLPGGQRPSASTYQVPGDWSGAAFPLVAGALCGVPMRLRGLDAHDPQGDRAIVSFMERFGQGMHWDGDVLCLEPRPLHAAGEPTSVRRPTSSSAGGAGGDVPRSDGVCRCTEPTAQRVRPDRSHGLDPGGARHSLRRGARWAHRVRGGQPQVQDAVASLHDHRIYMAARVLSLCVAGLTVDGAG